MIGDLVVLVLWALSLTSIAYYLVSIYAAKRFFSQRVDPPSSGLPPVSVLIPLCGRDFNAYENYASICRQNYPSFQLVFGVLSAQDSSIGVIDKLKKDFPETDIQLVVNSRTLGNNPKISNLRNMLQRARHKTLVLMDSDIRAEPDFLSRIVPHALEERVGLATCLYRGVEAPGMAAKLEAIGITAEFTAGVLVAWLTEGMSFALGATVVTTRDKLAAIGGVEAMADFLADDYVLGRLMQQAGYEVRLVPEVVETVLPRVGFPSLLRHQVRWSRGIRACRPGGHLGLVFTHGTVTALMCALASGGSASSLLLFAVTLCVRLWMGWAVGVKHLGDRLLIKHFLLLPVRDVFSLVVWILSYAGNRVEWRGRRYVILQGGRMADTTSRVYPVRRGGGGASTCRGDRS
jgi:ceramide glucosyltransferase